MKLTWLESTAIYFFTSLIVFIFIDAKNLVWWRWLILFLATYGLASLIEKLIKGKMRYKEANRKI